MSAKKDQSVCEKYELFWKEIVENPDGSLNKEQVMRELYVFSELISNLNKLYCYISGNVVSKPMTNADVVIGLFEERLEQEYNRGYLDATVDHIGPGSDDE